jgi:hypothetical protein
MLIPLLCWDVSGSLSILAGLCQMYYDGGNGKKRNSFVIGLVQQPGKSFLAVGVQKLKFLNNSITSKGGTYGNQ